MQPSGTDVLEAVGILCGLLAIIPALLLERRRKRRGIGAQPYAWAYYVGTGALLFGGLVGGTGLLAGIDSSEPGDAILALTFGAAYCIPGWFVIRRRRWAWVILTVMSLNPLSWIINYFYGKKRWSELSNAPFTRSADATPESGPSTLLAELDRLAALRDRGALSEDEFARAKGAVLSTPRNGGDE